MDFPVEATVHLGIFPNEAEVRGILRSHSFVVTDLSSDQVRVRGSFLKLKAVKASLEQILKSKAKTDIKPAPKVSSGAISKSYTSNSSVSDGNRGRGNPPHPPPSSATTSSCASSNKHPTSPEYRASFSPRPDRRGSFRPEGESFAVDADVFRYAERLRKKAVNTILDSHNVTMEAQEVGDSFKITLLGKRARIGVGKLQSLLNDLNTSLRTQEVPLRDMDRDGRVLLERIRKDKNIYNSVLVCQMNDQLHLIGPSGDSYELKQRLLGRLVDRSGHTGRTLDKNSRTRSSSQPPHRRDSGAIANPSPAGAAGYSPLKYQDDKQEVEKPKWRAAAHFGQGRALRGRSHSEPREKTRAERINVNVKELESNHKPPKSQNKVLMELPNIKDIKKKLKSLRK